LRAGSSLSSRRRRPLYLVTDVVEARISGTRDGPFAVLSLHSESIVESTSSFSPQLRHGAASRGRRNRVPYTSPATELAKSQTGRGRRMYMSRVRVQKCSL